MPKVTFTTDGMAYEVEHGCDLKVLCHEKKASLPFGCQNGLCGTCVIKVDAGHENFSPMADKERETLKIVSADPSTCRLACQCRVNGDIKLSNYY